MGKMIPFLIDAARQGAKKCVVDGKTFAPFGMVPHQVTPMKVSAYRPSSDDIPDKVDLRRYMTHVEDQAQTNSCCANAVAGAYEYINKRQAMQTGDSIADISRLFIYYVGRKKDQLTFHEDTSVKPKDEGMTLGGAISALEVKGACLETRLFLIMFLSRLLVQKEVSSFQEEPSKRAYTRNHQKNPDSRT